MKTDEYDVCEGRTVTELASTVERKLEDFWETTGGVCVVDTGRKGLAHLRFYQAVRRHNRSEPLKLPSFGETGGD